MIPLLLLTYVNASSLRAVIPCRFTSFDHDSTQTQTYIARNELLSIHIKDFQPLKLDAVFKYWTHLNIHFAHHLFFNNNFKSFEQLIKTECFRYLQLRGLIFNHPNWNRLIDPSLLEQYLLKIQEAKQANNYLIQNSSFNDKGQISVM